MRWRSLVRTPIMISLCSSRLPLLLTLVPWPPGSVRVLGWVVAKRRKTRISSRGGHPFPNASAVSGNDGASGRSRALGAGWECAPCTGAHARGDRSGPGAGE